MKLLVKYSFIVTLFLFSSYSSAASFYSFVTKHAPITRQWYSVANTACNDMANDFALALPLGETQYTGVLTAVATFAFAHNDYEFSTYKACDFTIHYTADGSSGNLEFSNVQLDQGYGSCTRIPVNTTNINATPVCSTPTPAPTMAPCPSDVDTTDIVCSCNSPRVLESIFNDSTSHWDQICHMPYSPTPSPISTITPTSTPLTTPTISPTGTNTPTPTPCSLPTNQTELLEFCSSSFCALTMPTFSEVCSTTPTPTILNSPTPDGGGGGSPTPDGAGSPTPDGGGGGGSPTPDNSGCTNMVNNTCIDTPTPTFIDFEPECTVPVPENNFCDCNASDSWCRNPTTTPLPTYTHTPMPTPSNTPTIAPTNSPLPTNNPTIIPTNNPTDLPTALPTPTPDGGGSGGGGSSPIPHNSSGGESCDSPPSCSGDEILCNLLKQEWHNRCDLINSDIPDSSGDESFHDITDTTVSSAVSDFNNVLANYDISSTCPAPYEINVLNRTYYIKFDDACTIMLNLRSFVIALFGMFAFFIVIRVKR